VAARVSNRRGDGIAGPLLEHQAEPLLARDPAPEQPLPILRILLEDASLVACGDKSERDRVRDSFLKKKLALTAPDAELDQAVMDVCQKMKADHDKSRVAFYYLLAEKFGKLAAFH
jgi:hypothetical protein